MWPWIIVVLMGLLLFSLLATHFFWYFRKPLLGFALGAAPIFLPWLVLSLMTERTLMECRRNVEHFCELTGVGILMSTVAALGLLVISAVVTMAFDVVQRLWTRKGLRGPSGEGASRRPLWLSLLIILTAAGLGLVIGWLLANEVGWFSAFWLAPMLSLAVVMAYMVRQERQSAV